MEVAVMFLHRLQVFQVISEEEAAICKIPNAAPLHRLFEILV